jgi:SAM-dependent methyltransferase
MTDHRFQPIDRWRNRPSRALRLLREEGFRGLTRRFEDKGAWAFLNEKARFALCGMFERAWDRAHQVDTSGQIDLESLEVVGDNRGFGHSVVSTSPRTFRFLARLFPADRSKYTFIDVGCGKGRVVLLASQLGFNRVIGVEFSPWAAEIAAANIRAFRGNHAGCGSCSIVVADALEYQLPNEPLVLYMDSPFRPVMFKRFFDRALEASKRHGKPIRLCVVGSSDSVDGAARPLMLSQEFRLIENGRAPYFLDTYLPFKYYAFDVVLGIGECVGTTPHVDCEMSRPRAAPSARQHTSNE